MGSELRARTDVPTAPVIDSVGIFWICWTCVWTVLVVAGMSYLVARRNTPLLRIRGLSLSLSAITLLHLYWISVQLGHIIGPLAPAQAEYWVMGIYYPFGIALFHASNSRFLHVSKAQKKYARHAGDISQSPSDSRPKGGILGRFRRLDYTSKVLIVVGLGMVFQVRRAARLRSCGIHLLIPCPALRHHLHVCHLPQVSSILRHPRHLGQRDWDGAKDGDGQRLGVVSCTARAAPSPIFSRKS